MDTYAKLKDLEARIEALESVNEINVPLLDERCAKVEQMVGNLFNQATAAKAARVKP